MSDPYRTLGLEPGASMPDVKRAYRRLAKAYHPDSAGEAALPRFLAIHEAYEAIRTGRPITPGRRSSATAAPPGPSAEPWRADPDRVRAAREQARRRAGSRAGRDAGAKPPGSGTRPSGTSGASGRTGSTGPAGAGARTGTAGEARTGSGSSRGGGGSRGRRHVRKATMGSTSYDEARDPTDPNDPTWSGASWYGPSSGEYWIINPREYADPRKHGPEYQSRARRMAGAAATDEAAGTTTGAGVDGDIDLGAGSEEAIDIDEREPRPTASGDAAWTFRTERPRARAAGRAEPVARPARPTRDAWAGAGGARGDANQLGERARGAGTGTRSGEWQPAWRPNARDLVGGPSDDPARRFGIALVAWPPIGLAAAALIGDVTGCSAFSADCGGTEPMLPWLAQAVILGLLLLLPPVARVLAGGAIGVLVALVPLTAFLVAVGGTGAPQAGFALAFLLGFAWLFGIAWAVAQTRRRSVSRAGP